MSPLQGSLGLPWYPREVIRFVFDYNSCIRGLGCFKFFFPSCKVCSFKKNNNWAHVSVEPQRNTLRKCYLILPNLFPLYYGNKNLIILYETSSILFWFWLKEGIWSRSGPSAFSIHSHCYWFRKHVTQESAIKVILTTFAKKKKTSKKHLPFHWGYERNKMYTWRCWKSSCHHGGRVCRRMEPTKKKTEATVGDLLVRALSDLRPSHAWRQPTSDLFSSKPMHILFSVLLS